MKRNILFISAILASAVYLTGCKSSEKDNEKTVKSVKAELSVSHSHNGVPCSGNHETEILDDHKGHNHANEAAHNHADGPEHNHAEEADHIHDDHTGHNHTEEGCSGDHDHEHDHAHDHEGHESHNHTDKENHNHANDHAGHNHKEGSSCSGGDSHSDDEIIISPEKAKNLGIKTTQLKPANFNKVIKTSGQILAAQGDEKTVVATTSGVVNFNTAVFNEGNNVKSGETILRISSNNILEGDPFIKAKAAYEVASKEYNRNKELVEDRIISQKEFDQSYERYITAKTSYDALAKSRQGSQTAVNAPISGFIKTTFVQDGEYVSVGQPLAVVSQNKRLRLRAEVSEKHYSELAGISSANFRPSYENETYKLSELNGKLISYGKSSTDNSFYIPVIFEFDNNGTLVPGAFTEVYLLSSTLGNVISVPVTALIEEQGSFFVFIKADAEGYVKKEVKTGHNNGKEVQILSGLTPGELVVTNGAYQVKLAGNSSAIPHGHEH